MRRATTLLILALFLGFLPSLPAEAADASLYLSPSTGTYSVGNTFSIVVKVNTGGVAINATEGEIVFSPDKLEVVSVSKSGSIFSLWTGQPVFSNSNGTVSFAGGTPNPGYTGAAGKIITITFRTKISGTVTVSFSSGAVLANDGAGTNILSSLGNGSYILQVGEVIPAKPSATPTTVPAIPIISSPVHADPNKWYNDSNPELNWGLSSDVTGVSVLLDDKPSSNPGPVSDGLFDSKDYQDLDDGVYYFHIKLRNGFGWSQITHYRIQIDTQPPRPFEVVVEGDSETDDPQPTLLFKTTDDLSGISYYEAKVGEEDFSTISVEEIEHNPYKMLAQGPGKHSIVVRAVDKAGNSTLAMAEVNILPIESPVIIDYPDSLMPADILSFSGTALPGLNVVAYVQQRGEEATVQSVQSDENGHWSYTYDRPVEKGIYKIWAQAIDKRGAQSLPTEKITIKVGVSIFFKIGEMILDHLVVAVSLLSVLAIIFFGSLYFWQQSRRFIRKLKKETREAEEALHKAFDALKEDVEEQLDLLNKVKSKRDLTKEEEKIRKNLNKNLGIAEKYIAKEITDIKKHLRMKDRVKKYFKK